jgi:hypothetical protein
MSGMWGWLTTGMVVVVVCLCQRPRPAWAGEDPEALIRQGTEVRRAGDDARAYGYYKRAYEIAHTPRSAAQLGLVEQSLGNFVDSETHLSEALAAADPWIDKNRGVLESSRAKVRESLACLELRGAPAGATARVGDRAAVVIPADGLVWVKPGDVTVRVEVPGQAPIVKNAPIAMGARLALDVAPSQAATNRTDVPASPPPTASPVAGSSGTSETQAISSGPSPARAAPEATLPGARLRLAGLGAGGAGVALGIVGLLVYRAGANKLDAINNAPASMPYDSSNDNYRTLGNTGVALMVGGGVAVAAGAVLYVLGHNQGAGRTESGVAHASVDPVSGGLLVRVGGHL